MKCRGFKFCKGYRAEPHGLQLPVRGTSQSAGYDFICPEDVLVLPGCTVKVKTGIKAYMQPGEVLMLFPRSSFGIKKGLALANTVGVIDADYYNNEDNEGLIIIAIRNEGQIPFTIAKGERFAQGVFLPFLPADQAEVLHKERKGGLGSTGE